MKNLKSLIVLAIAMVAFSITSDAQSTATATATATVVTPISIAKNTDMNFGNIAVTSSGGTVILATAGTRTKSGGVTLPATAPGTISAATFTVSGTATYAYGITLPTTVTLTHSGGVATMSAGSFVSNPSGTGGVLSAGGTQDIAVGATLTVSANQLAGVYVSSAFDVTVNYN